MTGPVKLINALNLTFIYWRASEASETLFSHVYGNSREIYIYIYIRTSVSNTHARVSVLRIKFKS